MASLSKVQPELTDRLQAAQPRCRLLLDGEGRLVAAATAEPCCAKGFNPLVVASCPLGDDYLAACAEVSGPLAEEAAALLSGLRQVLHGEREGFVLAYRLPCAEGERPWEARVGRLETLAGRQVWIEHEDLSARAGRAEAVEPRRKIEPTPDEATRQAEDELRLRAEQQRVLNRVLRGCLEDASLSALLLGALKDILPVPWLRLTPHAGIWVEDVPGRLELLAECNLPPGLGALPVGECVCGRVIPTDQVALCPVDPGADRQVALGAAHLTVPVRQAETLLGMMLVFVPTDHARPVGERQFLRAVADLLAGVIVRKRAEAARRAMADSLRRIAASVPGAIYEYELRRDGEVHIPFISAGVEPLLGVKADAIQADAQELLGRVDPGDWARLQESILRSAVELSTWTGEFRVTTASGEERWQRGTSNPRRLPDGSVLWSGMLMDITDRKRAEAELEQARDAAQAAADAKSRFLANVSHEIRTPLNAVIGMTELLLDNDDSLSSTQRNYLRTVHESGETLLLLINDLLDVTKIESGGVELEFQAFSLRDAVESSLELLGSQAAEKGIGLAYLIEDAGVPARVVGDRNRLKQVLVNLLSNAVKFSEQGDVFVTVGGRPLPLQRYELRFSVKDPGRGIAPERQADLFDAFTQGDPRDATEQGGTGLGLAICKGLVELMGGRIWVVSELGRGAIFHFTVVVQVPDALYLEEPPDRPVLAGRRLLIVDEHPPRRKMIAQQTEGWGLVPRHTGQVAQALAWLREERFDLVIVDRALEQGWRRLLTRMRALPHGKELPIILLRTLGRRGVPQEDDLDVLRELGVVGTLMKPVRGARLLRLLTDVITGRHVVSARLHRLDSGLAQRLPAAILVVEDHLVNQRVAQSIFARMGYQVDLANDGIEALEALDRRRYDLVLMDMQMPRMDGLETTARIRAERPREQGPLIVALTATATAEDRERCLAAGMDDYLGKPVRPAALQAMLERVLQPAGETGDEPTEVAASAPEAEGVHVNWRHLGMYRDIPGTEPHPHLLAELVATFSESSPPLLDAMDEAYARADGSALQREAHSLLGSARNMGLGLLADLCRELETRARAGDLGQASAMLQQIRSEYELVEGLLKRAP